MYGAGKAQRVAAEAGVFDSISKNIKASAILLNKLIAHRGPDSSGTFVEDNIFLAHTRLAIQDLSENGNQPMYSEDRRYVIVFNGEIYNHQDIRAKIGNNVTYRSTGDTETVLLAFIRYGQDCLNIILIL
jgi:asparagine synthase (glutamine-hydrolysing)